MPGIKSGSFGKPGYRFLRMANSRKVKESLWCTIRHCMSHPSTQHDNMIILLLLSAAYRIDYGHITQSRLFVTTFEPCEGAIVPSQIRDVVSGSCAVISVRIQTPEAPLCHRHTPIPLRKSSGNQPRDEVRLR